MLNPTEQFRNAIRSAGLHPPNEIEADGKLRRFATNGKRGDDSGWYVLHNDGIPAGTFGDWRSGVSQTWRADLGRKMSPAEDAAYRAKIEAQRKVREAEERLAGELFPTMKSVVGQAGFFSLFVFLVRRHFS
jgi:putative DNA primase/helicase